MRISDWSSDVCSSDLITAADLDEKRFPARQLAGLIDQWKNKGLTPTDIDAGESERYANGRGGELYAQYQQRLKTLNACDFGDLLLHMLVILKTHRDVLEQYQQRSEEHTSELQSLMRISYAVFCLQKKNHITNTCIV